MMQRSLFHIDLDTGRTEAAPAAALAGLRGCFVFARPTSGVTADASGLARSLREKGAFATAIIWADELEALSGGATPGAILLFDGAGSLIGPARLGDTDPSLYLSGDVRVSYDDARPGFVLSGGKMEARGAGDATAQPIKDGLARVLCDPEGASLVEFELDASTSPLPASFRYFFGPKGSLRRLTYPVFPADQPGPAGVRARLDPLRPIEGTTLVPQAAAPQVYRTNFRTPFGHPIALTTTDDSRFAFRFDPISKAAYQVIVGAWGIRLAGATVQPPTVDLMPGLSGVEYVKLAAGWVVDLHSDGPAYAPRFGVGATAGPTGLVARIPGIDHAVTTPWATFGATGGPIGLARGASMTGGTGPPPTGYYTQPLQSPFYEMGADATFLPFMELLAEPLPAGHRVPVAPYAGIRVHSGVTGTSLADYQEFEVEVLGMVRRNALLEPAAIAPHASSDGPEGLRGAGLAAVTAPGLRAITGLGPTGLSPTGTGPTGPLGPTVPTRIGVTPRGLLGVFEKTSGAWQGLTIVHDDGGGQALTITAIEDPLRAALLSNQLFLVVTDETKFLQSCSVQYQLTELSFAELPASGVPADVVNQVRYLEGFLYESASYFNAVLAEGLGQKNYQAYGDKFRSAAALARVIISGWTIDLSPYLWKPAGTFLIFKFADLPLEDLVADLGLWTLPGAFLTETPEATQKALQAFLNDAQTRARTDPDFRYFAETVCRNRAVGGGVEAWNGVLGLQCTVPLTQLPPQLEGLAAGMGSGGLVAHHVGVNASSVRTEGRRLVVGDTSLFGLIEYEDPSDLYYEGKSYAFKVLSLKVLFANSQVSDFSSQIELLVGALFGERSSLSGAAHGNNLVLNGVWQQHDGVDSYSFIEQGDNDFTIASRVLQGVTISKAQFVTVVPSTNEPGQVVQTRFLLWGQLRFLPLKGFDLFSFGPAGGDSGPGQLAFSNLMIHMSFNPVDLDKQPPAFAFDASQVAFDVATSQPREGSLYQRFPLSLTGMVQGAPGATPDSLGFIKLFAPIPSSTLSGTWYGLQMSLDLGSPGGLAAQVGFSASLLAAWAPNADAPRIYAGLKLPGSTSSRPVLTIEGPLQLRMADIQLLALDADDPSRTAYLLKFTGVSLGFLGVSFPPGGQINAILFGNPDPSSTDNSLGWYAAYLKDQPDGASSPAPRPIGLPGGARLGRPG